MTTSNDRAMPAKRKQHFLVTVQQMTTCDEADMVPHWSAVVAENDMKNFGALVDVPKLTSLTLLELWGRAADAIGGTPATNLRPMTLKEIARWREEN